MKGRRRERLTITKFYPRNEDIRVDITYSDVINRFYVKATNLECQ